MNKDGYETISENFPEPQSNPSLQITGPASILAFKYHIYSYTTVDKDTSAESTTEVIIEPQRPASIADMLSSRLSEMHHVKYL